MRRILWLCAAVLVLGVGGAIEAAQAQQDQAPAQSTSSQQSAAAAPKQDSLVEAARKAREEKEKKEAPKAAKVFTNDNLPSDGGVSTVGEGSASSGDQGQATDNSGQPAAAPNDEKTWREKFADLRHKLEQDQAALDVLQREAGVGMVQYYGGDPQKANQDQMSQQPMGADYNKKVADIDAKKKAVEADQQAISDAEDELRKAGGNPGWAR